MRYRDYFKKYYGIEFSKKYEIHHIDLNHNNDDITNLMLIPKDLHEKYHKAVANYNYIRLLSNSKSILNVKICGNMASNNLYNMEIIADLIEVLRECNKWYDYKMFLDGKLGNIHNINIER